MTHGRTRGDIISKRGAYILTRSPSLSAESWSLFRGEKWQTQLLTETLVGKAMPRRGKGEPPSLHLEIIYKLSKQLYKDGGSDTLVNNLKDFLMV